MPLPHPACIGNDQVFELEVLLQSPLVYIGNIMMNYLTGLELLWHVVEHSVDQAYHTGT